MAFSNPTSGTYLSYSVKGDREDLADIIYDISPEKTPFLSGCGRGTASNVGHEWQTDSLAATDTTNAQVSGFVASFTTPSATTRVGNYCQISAKSLIVEDRLAGAINLAGRRDEVVYQLSKRAPELKRDQESILLTNQAGNAGGSTTAPKLASLRNWLQSNTQTGSGTTTAGADSGFSSGFNTVAATDADTLQAFTETIAKSVIQSCWTNGGNPTTIMCGPVNRQKISTGFSGIVTRNYNLANVDPKPTAAIASVDVYVSDFGTLRVIPNRFQRERDAWFIDWDMVEVDYLRPFQVTKLAKDGDAEKRMLLVDYTLKVKNEAGLGGAFDLTTT